MSTTYLQHHGILGQRWGIRNGPPYPLDYADHSSAEKSRNPRSRIGGGSDTTKKSKKRKKYNIDTSNAPIKRASALGSGKSKSDTKGPSTEGKLTKGEFSKRTSAIIKGFKPVSKDSSVKEKLANAGRHYAATYSYYLDKIKRETSPEHEWDSIRIQSKLAKEEKKQAVHRRALQLAQEKVSKNKRKKGFFYNLNKDNVSAERQMVKSSERKVDSIIREALKKGYNVEATDVKRYALADKLKFAYIRGGVADLLFTAFIHRKAAMQPSKTYYVSKPIEGKKENPKKQSAEEIMKNTDFSKVPVKGASMFGSIGSGKSSNEKTTSNSSNEKTTSNSSNNKAPSKSELTRRLQSNNESDVNIALSYLSGLAERNEISESEFNKLVGEAAKKYDIGVVESNGGRYLMVYDRKKRKQ